VKKKLIFPPVIILFEAVARLYTYYKDLPVCLVLVHVYLLGTPPPLGHYILTQESNKGVHDKGNILYLLKKTSL
jgi:hypothetical protein